MPQFNYDKESTTSIIPGTTKVFGGEITNKKYKHNIVDTQTNSLAMLLTSISGSSYNVDYYSQVLGASDELRAFDPNEVSVYRQYQLIENYEFKLQDEISKDYDDKDNRLTATGTAITYPGLIPNKFDMFISDIGDGIAGLFTITKAVKKTYFQQTCYEINFELMYIVDQEVYNNINSLVVERTRFVKDYIAFGKDPVMVDERYMASKDLDSLLTDMLAEYLSEFYSYEYSTLLTPYDTWKVYDPFVASFILMIFDVNTHPLLSKIKQYNTDDPQLFKYISIYTILLKQQIRLLDNCFSKSQIIPVKQFSTNHLLKTVAFSGLDRVVMPITRHLNIDDVLGIGKLTVFDDDIDDDAPLIVKPAEGDYTIPNTEHSSSYLFTPAFYDNIKESSSQSDFENLVKKYLNKEYFDYKELLKFGESRDDWSRYQRFYLMPVLFLLFVYKIRSI